MTIIYNGEYPTALEHAGRSYPILCDADVRYAIWFLQWANRVNPAPLQKTA